MHQTETDVWNTTGISVTQIIQIHSSKTTCVRLALETMTILPLPAVLGEVTVQHTWAVRAPHLQVETDQMHCKSVALGQVISAAKGIAWYEEGIATGGVTALGW